MKREIRKKIDSLPLVNNHNVTTRYVKVVRNTRLGLHDSGYYYLSVYTEENFLGNCDILLISGGNIKVDCNRDGEFRLFPMDGHKKIRVDAYTDTCTIDLVD